MCGIVGILNLESGRPVDEGVLAAMTRTLLHRGPDDEGFYRQGAIGLGHRRLVVIDLVGGQQPMVDDERGLVIVFNGEIYNFRALQTCSSDAGTGFHTDSDTATLLRMARLDDDDWLDSLNGMFAFAIWDKRTRRLMLARDRLGIKPLYYTFADGQFLFASEIKSLLVHPAVNREVDPETVPEFLAFRSIPEPRTMFRGIKALLPGHTLRISIDRPNLDIRTWWSGIRADDAPTEANSQGSAIEQFESLFQDSIRHRLVSDVPVGTYNSGGVDSSLVTAAVRAQTSGELHTFSVGFEDPAYDESQHAQVVADRLGTHHHTLKIGTREYARMLPETVWHHDVPLNHAHTVQLLCLSRLAKEHVTVVLTGEGADETFAGYPRYQIPLLAKRLGWLPKVLHRGLHDAARRLGWARVAKLFEICNDFELSILEASRYVPQQDLEQTGAGPWLSSERRRVLQDLWPLQLPLLETILAYDRRTYLPPLLCRLDRSTMASGLEARVPFLDHRAVEWSTLQEQSSKVKVGRENKVLIKQLAVRQFPREMMYRRKVGFAVPLATWFRDVEGLRDYLDLITDDTFFSRGYSDRIGVERLVDDHLACRADHSEILWGLVSLELWIRIFVTGEISPANSARSPVVESGNQRA